MFISDDDIAKRVSHPSNLAHKATDTPRRTLTNYSERESARDITPDESNPEDSTTITPLHNGGRRPGDTNMSAEVRALVGSIARMDTARNVSEAFGVSPHHVHELKHGMHSTAQGVDENLANSINTGLKQSHDIAVQKLTAVLMGIDTTRVNHKNPVKAVKVAAGLARIAQQTNPIAKGGEEMNGGGVRLVIYAPTIKQENNYESVHALTPTQPQTDR